MVEEWKWSCLTDILYIHNQKPFKTNQEAERGFCTLRQNEQIQTDGQVVFPCNTHTHTHTHTFVHTKTTHLCFVFTGGKFYLADKSQGGIDIVLPLPQYSGIPGMGDRVQVSWFYWTHWGKRVKHQWTEEEKNSYYGCISHWRLPLPWNIGIKIKLIWILLGVYQDIDFEKVRVIRLPLWLSSAESVRLYWPRGFTATSVQLPSQCSTVHSVCSCCGLPPVKFI